MNMKNDITIVVPFEDAEKMTAIWAEEEAGIDFRKDSELAARCTASFAATELKKYLSRTLKNIEIAYSSVAPVEKLFIGLQIRDMSSRNDCFIMEPQNGGLIIEGLGRTGLLYGAYEFLRLQGWRWYAPGREGEIAPEMKDTLYMPAERIDYTPDMKSGRGLHFEGISNESAELWLWMARNRLNITAHHPATGPLGNKLGMTFKAGGHIFEHILDPDCAMPSGKTLWEEHKEWYGIPVNGKREKSNALNIQFCVSQPELLEFIGREFLYYLNGKWREADQIDIWGFDTWGGACNCENCRSLGNSTDQDLFLLSYLRDTVDKAYQHGSLDHQVGLIACAYEGTSTIWGPTKPIPKNILDAGDYVIFFPIRRCYAHAFSDTTCDINRIYNDALGTWFKQKLNLPVVIGEYYNVSRFEDLPILFTGCMYRDFSYYHSTGVTGVTYMHIPLVNWGIRTLTQVLYAQLAWSVKTDLDIFLEEFFQNWYGPYADDLRKVYDLMEKAWLFSADWRSWFDRSILTKLNEWDGCRPDAPFKLENHFKSSRGAIKSGRQSIAFMLEAKKILSEVRSHDRILNSRKSSMFMHTAVNPIEAAKVQREDSYEMRLGEDYRLLIYGLDTMKIMTELVAYHDALFKNYLKYAERIWQKIERIAEKLDSYYIPIGFEEPGAGLISKDALTRTQVRYLLRRIRKSRYENYY